MAVLMIGEVPEAMYAEMVEKLVPLIRGSKGFISHGAGPTPSGGWRIVEMWETEEDGQRWFDENIKLRLPPGFTPDRNYFPLQTAITK